MRFDLLFVFPQVFYGNLDNSRIKNNHFVPPFVARYIRIHPVDYKQRPALRMELLGCDLNSEFHQQEQRSALQPGVLRIVCVCVLPGCSLPLGLQDRRIPDESFEASSSYWSLLRSWTPHLARLHQEGSANAWRPKVNAGAPRPWQPCYILLKLFAFSILEQQSPRVAAG